jgi:hypothetical protein
MLTGVIGHMDFGITIKPELDPQFVPAVLWNRAFRALVEARGEAVDVGIALQRPDKTRSLDSIKGDLNASWAVYSDARDGSMLSLFNRLSIASLSFSRRVDRPIRNCAPHF